MKFYPIIASTVLLSACTAGALDVSTQGTDDNSAATIGGTVDAPGDGGGAPLAGQSPLTREEAEAILERVVALYQDHAAAANPAGTHKISWEFDWDSDAASAHVILKAGEDWTVQVTGGFLTVPSMTTEVFALTMCHEMGHFVGGFPFKTGRRGDGALGTSIAAEGQADYFATKDCLPRLWADETEANAAAFAELDPSARERCTAAYGDLASQQLCGRILRASLQTGRFYEEQAVLQAPREIVYPRLDTPDTTETPVTKEGHAPSQCRLDTLVAGALCSVKATGTEIPGFVPPYGEYSEASEEAARPFACQTGPGARPRCWFQPDTVVTDCSELGEMACVVEDGVHGVRYCDTTFGVDYYWCFADEVCKASSDGYADCYAPDVDPEEASP